ncbi:calcium-binding protein [uncultured Tateyamaria sp.]|uniref:calcium-binding protein n=1 Tax=uncultured Tateyamaria sp. TaxID=455651 RepID=UPI002602209C|nr:calcium-binding protein [uncultured Tateyamaria sp.]
MTVDLANFSGSGGHAEGDTYVQIQNVTGSDHNDLLISQNFADGHLVGGAGDDTLQGGFRQHLFEGGTGADSIVGGFSGQDAATYANSTAAVQVNLETGLGTGGEAEGDVLSGVENLIGSAQDDVLTGNAGNNTLEGGAGADTLDGGSGGTDTAAYDGATSGVNVNLATGINTGGDADGDVLINIDNLRGSAFDDTLTGDDASNGLSGQSGDDLIIGGAGADIIDGGADQDTVSYATSAEAVTVDLSAFSGSGGDAEGDQIFNVEHITGSAGDDVLTGDFAGNRIDGRAGADTMTGAMGDDTYTVDDADDVIVELESAGTDAVLASVTHVLGDNLETLTLTGTDDIDGAGNGLDNTVTGNAGNNGIFGGGGTNVLAGGLGDDAYYASAADTVTEDADAGNDTVYAAQDDSFTLSDNVENLVLDGTADVSGTGNAGDNLIVGSTNTGANTLIGLNGDDTYRVDSSDIVVEQADGGSDTVVSDSDYTLGDHVETLVLTGAMNADATGNSGDNTVIGNAGDNVLNGLGGNDALIGDGGNDTLNGGADNDTLEASGTDTTTINGGAGDDHIQHTGLGGTFDGGADSDTLFMAGSRDGYAVVHDAEAGTYTLTPSGAPDNSLVVQNIEFIVFDGMTEAFDDWVSDPTLNLTNPAVTVSTAPAAPEGTPTVATQIATNIGGESSSIAGLEVIGRCEWGFAPCEAEDPDGVAGPIVLETVALLTDATLTSDPIELMSMDAGVMTPFGDGTTEDGYTVTIAWMTIEVDGKRPETQEEFENIWLALNRFWEYNDLTEEERAALTAELEALDITGLRLTANHFGEVYTLTVGAEAFSVAATGQDGDDIMNGNIASDAFAGAAGNDELNGGGGFDTLDGGADNDLLRGNAGNELVNGASGQDTLLGGIGFDTMNGGDGNDLLTGADGFDNITGGAGNDTLSGNNGFDLLAGGDGNDLLSGGLGLDTLRGDAGDDTLNGQSGFDVLDGGSGNDLQNGNAGADTLSGEDGNDVLNGGINNDLLFGDAGNDTLNGGNGTDTLFGGDGDDFVFGNAGNDSLYGSAGDDLLDGGLARDTFFFDLGNDTITDFANNFDTIALNMSLLDETVTIDLSPATVADVFTVVGDNLVGDFGNGNTLLINGVTDFNLLLDDLIFY